MNNNIFFCLIKLFLVFLRLWSCSRDVNGMSFIILRECWSECNDVLNVSVQCLILLILFCVV